MSGNSRADDGSRGERNPEPAGSTRRHVLAGTVAGAVAGVAGLSFGITRAEPAQARTVGNGARPPAGRGEFVMVRDGSFWVGGSRFRFGGSNTYYLHQQSHYMIDMALDDAFAMSLPVIRAWAFADGSGNGYTALQPEPYVYDDAAFDSLDYAIWKAGDLGIRLVLALVNNWPDYGGMAQYVKWFLGLPDDSYTTGVNHDKFYSTPAIQDCYRAYVRYVMQRRNRYTGLRYNEDPAIMTFELANEPRSRSDKTGEILLNWVQETSAYFKRLAPRHLVTTGDEGFYGEAGNPDYPYSNYEGDRWKDFLALPTIDYGTVHLYPEAWGENPASKPGTDPVAWGATWISNHLSDGLTLGKPVVLEEYGVAISAAQGIPDEAARTAAYQAWTGAVLNGGGAGDQFWLLTSRVDDGSWYPDYDGFRIIWDNDPGNQTNATAQLLSAHAKAMASTS
jgi:mannan endo-1,4-beta-mannosidase